MTSADARSQVAFNVRAHARTWRRYEKRHPEIFNPVEQARLRASLERAIALTAGGPGAPRALDVGCGSGNLTQHLLELGCEVVSADVTPQFLRQVRRRYGVETFRLNGHDLGGLPDGSFDLVAAYSVLHHVPDYLGLVDDMPRVLRGGGVVYLDHEHAEEYFDPPPALAELNAEIAPLFAHVPGRGVKRFFEPWRYKHAIGWWYRRRRLERDPKWQPEGDIHIFEDQHIEWDRIAERLRAAGAEVVAFEKYLGYRPHYSAEVWERYRDRCADLALLLARRPEDAAR